MWFVLMLVNVVYLMDQDGMCMLSKSHFFYPFRQNEQKGVRVDIEIVSDQDILEIQLLEP